MNKYRTYLRYGTLVVWMLLVSLLLSGCFIQPDRTQDPLTVDMLTPQPLPSNTDAPTAEPTLPSAPTPAPTQNAGMQGDNGAGNWEDWGDGTQPAAGGIWQTQGQGQNVQQPASPTQRPVATESWETSLTDYNAGYPVLKVGSTGSDVYDLQERLKELGYYTGALDSKFASGTQAAVSAFQQNNGLTADGIAGRATQDKLYSSSAKAGKVAVPRATANPNLLKMGSQGTAVRKMQVRLAELRYYNGGADGIYGTSTESAVKTFQRNNGLSGDGQAGELTQQRLYGDDAKAAPSPVATANPNAQRVLSIGMEGNDVYSMQQRLITLKYLNGVADAVFGPETQTALIGFQQNNGLTVDGVAGASTVKKLNDSNAKPAKTAAPPTPRPGIYTVIREGDAGEHVYDLQERLYDLGYYNGRIDGRFGPNTTAAVYTFQFVNGLIADGIAGEATQRKLLSDSAEINPSILATPAPVTVVPPAPTAPPLPTPLPNYSVLQENSAGEDVKRLQQYLFDMGYYDGRVDGVYGASTTRAVRLLQYYNGLNEDGVAGPSTQALIYSGNAKLLPSSAATPMPNTNIVLQEGVTSDDVRQMQSRLFLLRYLEETDITGTFDAKTTAAVLLFQQRNGLTPDGVAGQTTLEILYGLYAEALILED